MKKIALEFFGILGFFSLTWFGLYQANLQELLNIRKAAQLREEQIGDFLWELIRDSEEEITDAEITDALRDITQKLKDANSIGEDVSVHVIKKDEVNAFALPNRHLVIFSGLIASCKNADELAGVMAHEIAHMENNHVMKKLISEIGLSALIAASGGNAGTEVLKELTKTMSGSAYDRKLEREADQFAVTYLDSARIDPEGLSDFLYRLGSELPELPDEIYWVSSHPESKERAFNILSWKGKNIDYSPALSEKQWQRMLEAVKKSAD